MEFTKDENNMVGKGITYWPEANLDKLEAIKGNNLFASKSLLNPMESAPPGPLRG